MATSDFWQKISTSVLSSSDSVGEALGTNPRSAPDQAKLWIVLDVLTILAATLIAIAHELHLGPIAASKKFLAGTLFQAHSTSILLAILLGFSIVLVAISRRFRLYSPVRLNSHLNEQHLSFRACFTAGLMLTGALYLLHASDIPRRVVLITVGLVTIALSARRFLYRILLYSRFNRGIDTRNVLIVGTGPEAHALRHHIESIRHLGFVFKGFITLTDGCASLPSASADVVGSLESLFKQARMRFVDEIFFTVPCERGVVQDVLDQARAHGIDLRVVPHLYGGLAWNAPIEYIGQFPTIPLHCGRVPEFGLYLKRGLDIVFSAMILVLLAPLLLLIVVVIKLDSHGPVLYSSERIGKKGRVFRCFKFRTMVQDAEIRLGEVLHMNERDGVLFKVTNDPRITRVGRILRKYSLDELPQFINVLIGDMSVVGPRPPIASEVREYKLSHLRRLDVKPGITGLWQVQGRQDPSFDSYVSLDVTYIENWSIWLDIKIIMRTVGVVLAGTGS